jgi:cation transport ATPase
MELPGTAYLYTLATLAMTFIGFSAIVMILRQTLGHKLSRFDVLLARVYMEFGLMISAGALLPPLLVMWGLPSPIIWRVSSGLAAIPLVAYALTYPSRRKAASGEATPFYVRLNVCIILLISLSLLVNASGSLPELAPAMFLTALTVFLIFAVGTFLQALNVMLKHPQRTRKSN